MSWWFAGISTECSHRSSGLMATVTTTSRGTWGATPTATSRAAIMLRERLRPYVLAQMKVAAERGIPPMRPLFFDFQGRRARRGSGR